MDAGKMWNSIISYLSSVYTLETIRNSSKRKKLAEIFGFYLLSIIGYFLSVMLFSLAGEILPKSLGRDFLQAPSLVLLIGVLVFLPLLQLWMADKKRSWLASYLWIVLTIVVFGNNSNPIISGIVALLTFAWFPYIFRSWKFPGWMLTVFATAFLALILLNLGVVSIDGIYGTSFGTAFLNNCSNTAQRLPYTMICASEDNKTLANYNLNCAFYPSINNVTGLVEFKLKNGMVVNHAFNGNFVPNEDIERLSFNFNGTDSNGERICFSTSFVRNFISEEEYKGNREKFVTYFLGLLYISIIGVPYAVLKIRKLLF